MAEHEDARDPEVLDTESDDLRSAGEKALVAAKAEKAQSAAEELAVAAHVEAPIFSAPDEHPAVEGREMSSAPYRGGRGDLRDFILGEVCNRSLQAGRRLKSQLTSVIELDLLDAGQTYTFDWQGADLKVEERRSENAECRVSMVAADLVGIAAGEINPQIAMLSDKIRVSGKVGLAVYFFNLIAPTGHH